MAASVAAGITGSFAFDTKAPAKRANAARFIKTTTDCVAASCSNTVKSTLCGTSASAVFKTDNGVTCSNQETAYIYKAD
jgi:hypothetical protein